MKSVQLVGMSSLWWEGFIENVSYYLEGAMTLYLSTSNLDRHTEFAPETFYWLPVNTVRPEASLSS